LKPLMKATPCEKIIPLNSLIKIRTKCKRILHIEQISKCHFIITTIRPMWVVTNIFEDVCSTFFTVF
jgi:hypothetical protein